MVNGLVLSNVGIRELGVLPGPPWLTGVFWFITVIEYAAVSLPNILSSFNVNEYVLIVGEPIDVADKVTLVVPVSVITGYTGPNWVALIVNVVVLSTELI